MGVQRHRLYEHGRPASRQERDNIVKVFSAVALVVSLCVGGPAAGEIVFGPYAFPDNAFADAVSVNDCCLFHVFPEGAPCPQGTPDVLLGFSPDCGLINTGTFEMPPTKQHNANEFQLDFTDLPATNGPDFDIVFFDAQFSADAYEIAVRVQGQPFGVFLPYDAADFKNLGLPGPSDANVESVIYALEIDLDTFAIAPDAVVDAIKFRSLAAKAGAAPQGDPVMAAVEPLKGIPQDICDQAVEIGLGDTAFSNIGAYTMGPPHAECLADGDDQVGSDVWFKWTAPCSGTLTASTCAGADFDTKLAVYENCTCGHVGLELIQLRECNDDAPGCGTASEVETSVLKDTCYLIRVGGFEEAQGAGTLTLSFKSFFDDCASAEILDGVEGLLNVCTIDSNTDGPPHAACSGQIDADRWYDYIAQCQGELTVSTCNLVDFDSKIAIYDGCGCPASDATLLACSDDEPACGGGSVVSVPIVSGNCYKVRLGGANGADGTGMISFSCAVAGACPWDIDFDGMVGVTDFLRLLAAWGPQPLGHPADFDSDGVVGVLDFLILIAHWGPCPPAG
jgi:hypothetical protein